MKLNGSAAIVFGGASGLGEATSERLAAEGAEVLIADVNETRAQQIARQIGASAVACDVTDPASVQAAVEQAAGLGRAGLRVCVVCAGLGTPSKLLGRDGPTSLETFARVINVNLLGTINVLRLVAGSMIGNAPDDGGERGVCVCTASIAAYEGQVGQIAYAASKGGVVGLTLPAARELAGHGVRVVTIAPGVFETPMLAGLPQAAQEALGNVTLFPHRLGSPAEYADLVEHVITNAMLNGEVIRLDGALRMAPR
jgi:NAD(P)-dependent dehydrogenase (short-subunit alcohol dehydrogenase family)